jgi:hypothetical protein
VESACDEECDVVDHVAIGNVVHECRQGADSVGADIAEFGDELVGRLRSKAGCGWVGRKR